MRVILVRWDIDRNDTANFVRDWRDTYEPLGDGLLREYLCKLDQDAPPNLNTMASERQGACSFLTVGFWRSNEDFLAGVAPYRAGHSFKCLGAGRLSLEVVAKRERDLGPRCPA